MKATRKVDVTNNGVTNQVDLIVDRNEAGEEAIGRAIVYNSSLLSAENRLPVDLTFPTSFLIRTAVQNPSLASYIATSAGANVKNAAGTVYAISCINTGAATRYLQLFNKATAPVANDIPREVFAVYANGGQLLMGQDYFTINGLDFTTGISWGISTVPGLYTAGAAAETIFTVRYL